MYSAQVYWEDVAVGQEIPTLVKHPNQTQLVMWAGAVDDYNPMHQDKEIAIRAGYPGPIVFGPLTFAFLEQMLSDWMGVEGWLKKITVRHLAPAFPDEDMICKGKITQKYVKEGEHYVDLQIQTENSSGKVGTTGSAIIILPPKAHARPLPYAEPIPITLWLAML